MRGNREKGRELIMMDRRSFLKGAFVAGAAVTGGAVVAGCAPSAPATTAKASDAADVATPTAETGTSASSWLTEPPAISDADLTDTLETKLLIVGAGNAGMIAAATACDEGVDFLVVDSGTMTPRGRTYIGAVNTKYTKDAGVEVDEAKLLNELTRYASGKCDQRVMKLWIGESAELIDWLDGILVPAGYTTILDTAIDAECGGTDYYVPVVQHTHRAGEGVDPSLHRNNILESYINERGHEVLYGYNLVALARDEEGPVTGAYFETSDGYVLVKADDVLLATGGYAANADMLRALAPDVPTRVTTGNFVPTNTGQGIICAMNVGAAKDVATATMIFDRGACKPGTKAGYVEGTDQFPSAIDLNIGSQPFLKVNVNGERFANESCPYDTMLNQGSLQPGGVYCQIMDSTMKEDIARFATIGCSKTTIQNFDNWFEGGRVSPAMGPTLPELLEQGVMVKADSLDELAAGLGLPADTFKATVDRYNELFAKGVDEDFGKESYRLSSLDTPPYYGFTMSGSMLTTIDGLRIDNECRVLDTAGAPIEGLYAAGDCSGSFFADNYPEYIVGVACGRTLTFARHVVKALA